MQNCLSQGDTSLLEAAPFMASPATEIMQNPETEVARRFGLLSAEGDETTSPRSMSLGLPLGKHQSSVNPAESEVDETYGNPASNFIPTLLPEFVPDSDKILPQEVLEDMIHRLDIEVYESIKASYYQQAEKQKLSLIEAHEDLYRGYEVPPTDSGYRYEKIAHKAHLEEICKLQDSSTSLEAQGEGSTATAELLVEILLKRGYFHAAESVQKNIMKRSWHNRHSLHDSQSPSPDIAASEQCIYEGFSRRPSTTIPVVADLFTAIEVGDECQVQDFLRRNPDLSKRRHGKSAIMHAVERGNLLVVEILKEAGASLQDALFYSVRNGNVSLIKPLLALGAKIEEVEDGSRLTPLLVAVGDEKPKVKVLEELLHYNANTDAQDAHGWKAIHHIAQNRDVEMMETFLQDRFKANVNAVDIKGKTALHYLAVSNNVSVTEILLRYNASTSMKDNMGRTALQIAVNRKTGATDFVELMLRKGMVIEESDLREASLSMKQLFQDYPENVIKSPTSRSESSSLFKMRSRSKRSVDSGR